MKQLMSNIEIIKLISNLDMEDMYIQSRITKVYIL